MARIDSLTNFLTDVATAIRTKKGTTTEIAASDFDTEIESIETGGEFEITNGNYLFQNNDRIDSIDNLLPLCNNMTTTYYMFRNANNINIPIDLAKGQLDTLTYEASYLSMFYNCSKIPSIKISSISNKPTIAEEMFYNCSGLKSLDVSGLTMDSVNNMTNMFYNCSLLTELDISNFNTSKLTQMRGTFSGCNSLTNIPIGLTSLNTNLVQTVEYILNNCYSLSEIDLSDMSFPVAVKFSYAFSGCKSATKIVLPTNSNKTTNISYMFAGCDNLKEIDWSRFNTSKVTSITGLFSGTSDSDKTIEGTLDVDLSILNLSSITTMNNASKLLQFNRCVRTINLSPLSGKTFTGANADFWCQDATSLIELDLSPISLASSATSIRNMFNGCKKLKTIDGFADFVASATALANNGMGIYHLFANCESLESIDLSTLKTGSITNGTSAQYYRNRGFCEMFYNCKSLINLDISNFVINSSVTSLYQMFAGCSSLESLSLPDFTGANITDLSHMFDGFGTSNTVINNLSKIDFAKATDISYMFYNSPISQIVLPVPETIPSVKKYSARHMFDGCSNLTSVDARVFGPWTYTANWDLTYMFANCQNLVSVDLSNYYNTHYMDAINYMFMNCISLKEVKFHHQADHYIFSTDHKNAASYVFDGCSSIEVIDLRYCMPKGTQMNYGTRLFANCRKLRKLDLRGSGYGQLGRGNSAWANGSNETLLNCGVDNPTPTIVYTDNTAYQVNLIDLGNKFGLGWSTENVIVVEDPEQEVDMS